MHITIRTAWHDNKWNGKVCLDPESNTYCTGAHSLLSSRIEKQKNTEVEKEIAGFPVEKNVDYNYTPPCYWSINAFGPNSFEVDHQHPFSFIDKSVKETVKPYSVFTWPFKISFVHTEKNQKKHGNYWPDLEKRIDNFINKFSPGKSIIFFYANYDNPVSADDMKYLLLGCSVTSEVNSPVNFDFSEEELKSYRNNHKMKNFPAMHWGIQFSHDPNIAVLLPYQQYIHYAEKNPEDEEKLHDMRVVIEEPSLVSSFKYVAMDIDDDKCLYLLYKLRKSIYKIREHNQIVINSDLHEEEERLNKMIEMSWEKRGVYPGLDKVLGYYLEEDCSALSQAIQKELKPKYDIFDLFEDIFGGNIPEALEDYHEELEDLIDTKGFNKYYKPLLKLSLFNLTKEQVRKIIESDNRELLLQLEQNPYVLYEEYRYRQRDEEMDIPDLVDENIDIYKLDIGMIPDRKFVKRHRNLQDLREDSPERVRSEIINYLWRISEEGHSFDNIRYILKAIKENALIYKTESRIDETGIIELDEEYEHHFKDKLDINKAGSEQYYYLKEIQLAERRIKEIINLLLNRPGHTNVPNFDISKYINDCTEQIKVKISDFDDAMFSQERGKLYKNIFEQSLYLLTGKPGSGKTFEASQIIKQLNDLNEVLRVLAPTGKAALRLSENIKTNAGIDLKAQTIDRFIYENGFYWAYEDWDRLQNLPQKEKVTVGNLIIDESSMLDLHKLYILFSIIKFNDQYPRRVIFVGDENQLPPIGIGKPFHDIIQYLLSDDSLFEKHYIHLTTNCRQENDPNVLRLAEAFSDKNRYYEESLELVKKKGDVSEGLSISYWKNKGELQSLLLEKLNDLIDKELYREIELIKNKMGTVSQGERDKLNERIEQINSILPETSYDRKLNILYGLYDSGYVARVNNDFKKWLNLEKLQLVSPYRTAHFGTVSLNKVIQANYRKPSKNERRNTQAYFYHSDKIIRTENYYSGYGQNKKLVLSNGSIGIINRNKQGPRYYFKDADYILKWVDTEENFDLAYTITVHKSQGSDFNIVFLIIPNKLTLLSKELIYTALTRSKNMLHLFIYDAPDNLLIRSKGISNLLQRNSSIFEEPEDKRFKYYPRRGEKPVKSKVEYIIHQALQKSGLSFSYEAPLQLPNLNYPIHPDFTIRLDDGTTYYWEHLGMLDQRKYFNDWLRRREDFRCNGMIDYVVTTDDLDGIEDDKIDSVIEDIRTQQLKVTPDSNISNHHYKLY